MQRETVRARIERKVAIDPITGCWLWTGRVDRDGYGEIAVGGEKRVAHRIAYGAFRGPIPTGLTIDHLCRRRPCVNPAHLEPVTIGTNVLRGANFTSINAVKTTCMAGHPYDRANTYIRPNGHRDCRACTATRQRRYQARRVVT